MPSKKLFDYLKDLEKPSKIGNFPAVVVDQTNYRIGDIIRRNQAGEQVMGNQNLNFDYTNESQNYDPEKVNPFSDMGFDLDDVIILAEQKSREVTELQNRQGELKRQLDEAKKVEEEQKKIDSQPASGKEEPK